MTAGAGALGGAVWGASGTGAGAGAASAGTSMAGASLLRILGPIGLVLAPTTLGDGTLPPEVWAEAARKQEQAKTQSQAKTRDIATTNNCRGPQDKACQQGKHSGRIQAQEDKITYIPAAVAGSAWTDLPYPPGLGKCRGYADNCRNALKALSGSDRGKNFKKVRMWRIRIWLVGWRKSRQWGYRPIQLRSRFHFILMGIKEVLQKPEVP